MAVGTAIFASRWRPAAPPALALGAPAPDFQLADLAGRAYSLARLRGRVVLLNFWATWCPSCQEEMPLLEGFYRRHRLDGFTLLAASVDNEGRKAVIPFAARYSIDFPIVLCDARTAKAYGIYGLPASFLIDAEGRLARAYVGPLDKAAESDIIQLLNRRHSRS